MTEINPLAEAFKGPAYDLSLKREHPVGVDLACGSAGIAVSLASIGYHMTAVDRKIPPKQRHHTSVDWVEDDLVDWMDRQNGTEQFDVIWCRNALQFIEKERVTGQLFPAIRRLCRPGGIVILATFSRLPEPNFYGNPWRSVYSFDELTQPFEGWEVLFERKEVADEADLRGIMRRWWRAQVILRKPETGT